MRQQIADRYAAGRDRAIQSLMEDEPAFAGRAAIRPPYAFEQILGDWWPEKSG